MPNPQTLQLDQDEQDGIRISLAGLHRLRGPASSLGMPPPGILSSLFPGAFRARYHGRGLEFLESRQYQTGDDFRNLDWRVTARSGRLHTKLFQEEREQQLFLLLDAGLSMHFGSYNAFKWVVAAQLAGLVAWLALNRGDRLGCLLFGTSAQPPLHPPATGEAALNRLFQQLAGIDRSQATTADLETALRQLRAQISPGSLVLILSDFLQPPAHWQAQLTALAQHNELAAITLYDPLEADLPAVGSLPVGNGHQVLQIDTGDPLLRQRYRQSFDRRLQEAAEPFRRHRGVCFAIGTQQDPAAVLRRRLHRPVGYRHAG